MSIIPNCLLYTTFTSIIVYIGLSPLPRLQWQMKVFFGIPDPKNGSCHHGGHDCILGRGPHPMYTTLTRSDRDLFLPTGLTSPSLTGVASECWDAKRVTFHGSVFHLAEPNGIFFHTRHKDHLTLQWKDFFTCSSQELGPQKNASFEGSGSLGHFFFQLLVDCSAWILDESYHLLKVDWMKIGITY